MSAPAPKIISNYFKIFGPMLSELVVIKLHATVLNPKLLRYHSNV